MKILQVVVLGTVSILVSHREVFAACPGNGTPFLRRPNVCFISKAESVNQPHSYYKSTYLDNKHNVKYWYACTTTTKWDAAKYVCN